MLESCRCFPLGEEAERESTVGDVSGPRKEFESIPVQELDGQTSVPDVIFPSLSFVFCVGTDIK